LAGSSRWRVRRGSSLGGFEDMLVLQGRRRGMLDLLACRARACDTAVSSSLLTPLIAASVSEGVRRDTGIVSWLHWPNLVTIDGAIVAVASVSALGDGFVFEVHLNCFSDLPLTRCLGLEETSIKSILGVEIELTLVREKILHALDWYFAEWERGQYAKLVERFRPTIPWMGGKVRVVMSDGRLVRGIAAHLDEQGGLAIHAGTRSRQKVLRPDDVRIVLPDARASLGARAQS
jgi:biotin-(acetyl-CoA carboxylase) ligase